MKRKGNILLYPFSVLYGGLTGFRNFLYNSGILKSHELEIPVICVGNITVGGTGKTPHCEYLIDLLKDRYKVALLSRGYRRKTTGFLIVNSEMTSADTGDEPMQIFRKFPAIVVAVDSNRANGLRSVVREKPDTDVIILDDGFQHRRVKPGFSILLTDYSRLMIHDKMLPYGDLRESVTNMYRADIILVTKSPWELSAIERGIIAKEFGKAPWQNLYFTTLSYGEPVLLFPGKSIYIPLLRKNSSNSAAVLVTGIANPEMFRDHVSSYASELIHLSFPDHHNFASGDIERINEVFKSLRKENRFIVTTEKDAIRLKLYDSFPEPARSSIFYLPVKVSFLNDDGNDFDNHILEYVRKNKRNSRVSQEERI